MWPFKKRLRTKHMTRITFADGQELVGEEKRIGVSSAGSVWVRSEGVNKRVHYPQQRARSAHFWTEVG